jgi:hypothetical protein
MDVDDLSDDALKAFATVFWTEEATRAVLERAGLARHEQPAWGRGTPMEYWRQVARLLHSGKLPDGPTRLLAAAHAEFPANPAFFPTQRGQTVDNGLYDDSAGRPDLVVVPGPAAAPTSDQSNVLPFPTVARLSDCAEPVGERLTALLTAEPAPHGQSTHAEWAVWSDRARAWTDDLSRALKAIRRLADTLAAGDQHDLQQLTHNVEEPTARYLDLVGPGRAPSRSIRAAQQREMAGIQHAGRILLARLTDLGLG